MADEAPPARGRRRQTTAASAARRRWARRLTPGWLVALLAYALSGWLAVRLVDSLGLDPTSVRGATMPIMLGAVVFAALLAAGRRAWRREHAADLLAGLLAGLYAGWLVLIAKAALFGTPHGFGGLEGDTKRIVAMAVRYTTTWRSADTYTKDVPAEYPPLFPWLIGRFSALTGEPPWRVMATAQIIALSGAMLLGYLLWRWLVGGPLALALAVVSMAPFSYASKGYEVLVLVVLVPWLLATFARPPRGRLNWAVAGLIGGLIVLMYQGFFVFALPGVLAIMYLTLRRDPDRRGYLLHLAGVAAVSALVAAPYVYPYLHALATRPHSFVADTYDSRALIDDPVPLPFLEFTHIGVLCLAGLIGLVWCVSHPAADRAWWALPMTALVAGVYVFIGLASLRWALSGHNLFVHYASRLLTVLLVCAAVLATAELLRALPARSWRPAARRTAFVLAVALGAALTVAVWRDWGSTPGRGRVDTAVGPYDPTNLAHEEPLPDGSLPRFAPAKAETLWLPVDRLREEVEARLGDGARPVTLSVDERIFAYEPWWSYVNPWRTSAPTLSDWPTRHEAVTELMKIKDPAAFAAASDALPYGGVDVYLLRNEQDKDRFEWLGGKDMVFDRAQFGATHFDVVQLPNHYVAAIRER